MNTPLFFTGASLCGFAACVIVGRVLPEWALAGVTGLGALCVLLALIWPQGRA